MDTLNYFEEVEAEPVIEEEQYSFLQGICSKCLDSGFVHTVKDGVLGVAYTSFTQNSAGIPQKKLMVCKH